VFGHKILLMRPVVFGEALPAGTRLTLFSADKPDRFFTVIEFWIDKTSAWHSSSTPASLPITSMTAGRAVALAEAGGKQNASPDPSAD